MEFEELKAADRLGLLPHPWRQTARICVTLARVFGNDKVTEDMFMPGYRRNAKKTRERRIDSVDSLVASMRQNHVGESDEFIG